MDDSMRTLVMVLIMLALVAAGIYFFRMRQEGGDVSVKETTKTTVKEEVA